MGNGARGTVYQSVRVGPETTRGTIVPATHRLLNFEMNATPDVPAMKVKYPGSKAAIGVLIAQDMTNAKYSAKWDFNLLHLICNSIFGGATDTTPGVLSQQHIWTPSPTAPIVPNTYSFEQGSSKGGEIFGYGFFTDVTMKWTKEDVSLEGNIVGQTQLRDQTMTPSIPNFPVNLAMPGKVGVYLSTDGGTAFTRLGKNLEGDFKFGAIHKPVFHVSDLNPSFDDTVEISPDFQVTLTGEEGSEASAFMTKLRNGQMVHLGIKVQGPLIETIGSGPAVNYYNLLQVRLPVFVTKPAPGDKSGVWANTFTFDVAHDEAFGLASFTIINSLAAIS